jgi:hypothetical protein
VQGEGLAFLPDINELLDLLLQGKKRRVSGDSYGRETEYRRQISMQQRVVKPTPW